MVWSILREGLPEERAEKDLKAGVKVGMMDGRGLRRRTPMSQFQKEEKLKIQQ